ncbi:MAG: alkaline phosphatase D family protein, partial [Acidimicrobiales bacterium]
DVDALAVEALGHSVHVDAVGLSPDTVYWYRFTQGEFVSDAGRARTFPTKDSDVDEFRFAFSSCQNYEQGFYAAHRYLADEDIHAFIWLGDYIYEYGPSETGVRQHDAPEVATVEDYRNRYALYKQDSDLQAAHRAHAWIATFDDHEVDNNYAGDVSENNDGPAEFRERRAAAYQAWYEHMPVRLAAPDGPDYPIYRRVDVGNLISFYVLDTRQYRDDQPDDGALVELPVIGVNPDVRPPSPDSLNPDRTMLGADQEQWLQREFEASTARWNVLAQQVFMFGPIIQFGEPLVIVDTWDGYAGPRERLLSGFVESTATNLVVLTGDFHSAAAADLRPVPEDLAQPVVGAEFMASSIASSFFGGNDASFDALVAGVLAGNEQMKFFDARGGYVVCAVTEESWSVEYRAISDRTDPDASISTIARFTVEDGIAGITKVSIGE